MIVWVISMKRILLLTLVLSAQYACASHGTDYNTPVSIHRLTSFNPMSITSDSNTVERKKLAAAILELHELYISTGEEKIPMTISLPDMAAMADLSKEATERVTGDFIKEKLISVEKSAITILDLKKLKKIGS
ncbi:MAG: hypothetical protein JWO58_1307 [Chitinophagaceae bacterium]|nr:hypothetical protein [Chitinophagaceae bacterium]